MIQMFGNCIVVSEVDKQILRDMGVTSELYVVPNGTDTKFFRALGKKTVERSVLWVGHMDVHTNRDAVLHYWREVYPIIRRREPGVRMTFVGTSPPREIVRFANRDKSVRTTGFVEDIRPYVEEAAVVVVPVRIGSGTRVKILDCMAMGKGIVSTAVGCEGLDVTNGKNIVVADGAEAFANGTIGLLRNEGMRRSIGNNARSFAEQYDWSRIIGKQEDVYKEVIGRRVT
jgi:glycosyltransferase involved in cell wall biosynthesis